MSRKISEKLFEKLNSMPPSRRAAILISLPKNLADLSDSDRFIELMTNFHFVTSKIALLDTENLIQDYDLIDKKEFSISEEQQSNLRAVQKIYRLATSLHSPLVGLDEWLEKSDAQESSKQELLRLANMRTYRNLQVEFACQLWGRLSYSSASILVKSLLDQAKETLEVQRTPWLRPVLPSLTGTASSTDRVLAGHDSDVTAIAITPDGKFLMSGDNRGDIILWNLEQNQSVRLEDHKSPQASWYSEATLVLQNRFSNNTIIDILATSDSKRFISGSWDGTIIVWDIEKQVAIHHLVHDEYLHLQQKNFFATILETARNISKEEEEGFIERVSKWRWDISNVFHSFAIDESGKKLISSYFDNAILVWDIETGSTVYVHNRYSISREKYATNRILRIPNSNIILLHNSQEFVMEYGLSEQGDLSLLGTIQPLNEDNERVTMIDSVVSPDGERIIFSNYAEFYVCSTRTRRIISTFKNQHNDSIQCLTFTPDSKYLISTSSEKTLIITDIQSSEIISRIGEQAIQSMWKVVASPGGNKLFGSLGDSLIKIWDIKSLSSEPVKDIASLDQFEKTAYGMVFTPDSTKLIVGRGKFKIQMLDIKDNCNLIVDIDRNSKSEFLCAIAVSPSGQRIISSSNNSDGNQVSFWDINSGELLLEFVGHSSGYHSGEYRTSDINAIAISPNAKVIVTASKDFSLKIWKLKEIRLTKTGQVVVKPTVHTQLLGHSDQVKSVAVTPDGKWVVSASSDEVVIVWDIVTGDPIHILKKHYVDVSYKPHLDVMILSNDGKKAFTSSQWNREIKIWDIEKEQVVTLDLKPGSINCGDGLYLNTGGHTKNVRDIALTHDDRYLITCSYHDSTVNLWDFSRLTEEKLLGELRYLPSLLTSFTFETKIRCCVVSPDGKMIAVGDDSNKAHLLQIENIEISQTHYATKDTKSNMSHDSSSVSCEANIISQELYEKSIKEKVNQRILETRRLRVFVFLVFSVFALLWCVSSPQLENLADYLSNIIESKFGVFDFLQYRRFFLILSVTSWLSSAAIVFLSGKNLANRSSITWERFASPTQVILLLYFAYYLCPEYARVGSKLVPIIGFVAGGLFGIILAFISAGLVSLLIWVLFIMPLLIIDTRLKKLLSRSKILPSD
jgi:WD40 repeat protein